MNIMQKLGIVIREKRIKDALSQEDLAELVNLHRTYIGSVERGERNISIENIQKISKALNITLSELFKKVDKL